MIYRLSAQAYQDIDDISGYISNFNQKSTEKYLKHIFGCFEILARFPLVGQVRPDITDKPLYFWPSKKYMIVYQIKEHVEIIRILSTYQDLRNHL